MMIIKLLINKTKENITVVVLLLLFVFMLFFNVEDEKIFHVGINYLFIIIYIFCFLTVLIIILTKGSKSETRGFLDQMVYFFINHFLVVCLGSYVLALVLIFPINRYNKIVYSSKNKLEVVECDLVGISKRRQSRGFYFSYLENKHFIRGFYPIFNIIEKEKNTQDYKVLLHFKQGILNSYVIESWKIIHSKNN